ncbi:MAG: class I SAM-dependent methyltransferase [Candidatus Diapherotrites archaeon]
MIELERIEFLVSAAKGKTLDVGFNPKDTTLHNAIVAKLGEKKVIAIDTVVEKASPNTVKASAEKMPFKNNCFDCIIAGELIEHLQEPQSFIKECSRLLKKNGTLALSTPNKKSWINRLFHSYEAPLHFSLFSLEELKALLEKHSFKIISVKMLPYTMESSEGSKHKWFMPVRAFAHIFLPNSLRENTCITAEKK